MTTRWELRSANPYESWAGATPLRGQFDGWEVAVEAGIVSVSPAPARAEGPSADPETASFLRAWQLAAYLRSQHEIWFAQIDGDAAVPELFPEREHVFRRVHEEFPAPDSEFRVSPEVERMLVALREQLYGSASPIAAGAAVLDALDGDAANVDAAVVNMLRDLVARGEPADIDIYRTYRGPEWQWLQEAVRLVMLQVGRARPGTRPSQPLTMASFSTSLPSGA